MFNIILMPRYDEINLVGPVAKRIEQLLSECIAINGWELEKLNIEADQVQILVWLSPDVSLDKVIKIFKSGTSRIIMKEFPEFEELLQFKSFWSDGCFVQTVGTLEGPRVSCKNKLLI